MFFGPLKVWFSSRRKICSRCIGNTGHSSDIPQIRKHWLTEYENEHFFTNPPCVFEFNAAY